MIDDIEGTPLVEETAAPEVMPDDQPAQEAPPPVEQAQPEQPQHERQPSVPVAELTRERRAFQARLDAQERQFNERLGMMARELDGLRPPKPAEPEIKVPDPSQDLMGYLDAHRAIDRREQQKLAQQLEEMQRERQHQQQRAMAQDQETQMVHAYQADARDFAREYPDFGHVYAAWLEARTNEWRLKGKSPAVALQLVKDEERDAVAQAFANGQRPAETIYTFAKYYYRPAPAAAPAAEPARAPNGQFVAAKPPTPAPKSLSQTRGTPGGQNTTDDILSMSDAEFRRRFCSDNDKDAFKKLWG